MTVRAAGAIELAFSFHSDAIKRFTVHDTPLFESQFKPTHLDKGRTQYRIFGRTSYSDKPGKPGSLAEQHVRTGLRSTPAKRHLRSALMEEGPSFRAGVFF